MAGDSLAMTTGVVTNDQWLSGFVNCLLRRECRLLFLEKSGYPSRSIAFVPIQSVGRGSVELRKSIHSGDFRLQGGTQRNEASGVGQR